MPPKPSLRRLSRQEPTNEELTETLQSIVDLPDRMAAIIMASLVESDLEKLIIMNLPIKDKDMVAALTERDGALSTFFAKIDLSYALALVSSASRNNLHCIRRIRNAFAHAPRPIAFTTEEVSQECSKLRSIKTGRTLSTKRPERIKFILVCSELSIFINEELIADEEAAEAARASEAEPC